MSTYEVIDIEDTQASVTVGGMAAAITLYRDDQLPDEEWLAACLLIKAAPDLLTELQKAADALDFAQAQVDHERDRQRILSCLRDLDDVIAKAEGRE